VAAGIVGRGCERCFAEAAAAAGGEPGGGGGGRDVAQRLACEFCLRFKVAPALLLVP